MAVLGFNYTKLLAERMQPVQGKVSINNNVTIIDVSKTDLEFMKSKTALDVKFRYISAYQPEIARLTIEGSLLYVNEDEKIGDLVKHWEDNKSLPKSIMADVMNYVLSKCNVQAIIMSRDLNIPSPIPLPKITKDEGKKTTPKKAK